MIELEVLSPFWTVYVNRTSGTYRSWLFDSLMTLIVVLANLVTPFGVDRLCVKNKTRWNLTFLLFQRASPFTERWFVFIRKFWILSMWKYNICALTILRMRIDWTKQTFFDVCQWDLNGLKGMPALDTSYVLWRRVEHTCIESKPVYEMTKESDLDHFL